MDPISNVQNRSLNELGSKSGWFLTLGIGLVILGTIAIFVPFVATLAIENFIGLLFVVGGIMHLVHAFRWRTSASFSWILS